MEIVKIPKSNKEKHDQNFGHTKSEWGAKEEKTPMIIESYKMIWEKDLEEEN
jgi:hypothetical protein